MKPRGRSSFWICSAKKKKWDRCLSTKWRRQKPSWRKRKKRWGLTSSLNNRSLKVRHVWFASRCATFVVSSFTRGLSSSSGCTRKKRGIWRRKDGNWRRRWTRSIEERLQLRHWWDRPCKAAHNRLRRTRTRRSKSALCICLVCTAAQVAAFVSEC